MSWSMHNTREARLAPGDVFRFYVDPSTWGRWGHNTVAARGPSPVKAGDTVHVMAGYRREWPVLIRQVVPDNVVVCEVRPPGVVIVSTYEVTPTPDGVRLRHEMEVSGRLSRAYRLLKPLYVRLLAKETRRLVELASRDRGAGAVATPGGSTAG